MPKKVPRASNDDLLLTVKTVQSLGELLKKLGYHAGHASYMRLRLNKLGADLSHFHPLRKLLSDAGKRHATDLEEIFRSNTTTTDKVRRAYRDRTGIRYYCVDCGNEGVHNSKPLVLELDHINGDSRDNRLWNLRWLCPNCHSQTSTFRGRNKRK